MIYSMLYDWQKKLVNNYKNRYSFGLFLDMGLGKTPISLALAEENNCTKVLIITLNSKAIEDKDVKGSWLNWSKKSKLNYKLYSKFDNLSFDKETNELFIINYENIFKKGEIDKKKGLQLSDSIEDFIKSCKNHNVALIIDESYMMKNSSSKRTKAINKIKKTLKINSKKVYSYLLNGTPFKTEYLDLYSQLSFLGYKETKGKFKEKFCILGKKEKDGSIKLVPGLMPWEQPIGGYKNIDELFELVHQYSITIKSKEVQDLPPQIYIEYIYPQTKEFELFTYEKLSYYRLKKEFDLRKIDKELSVPKNIKTYINNPFYRNIDYPNFNWLAETSGNFWLRARQLSIGFQGNEENSKWFNRERLNLLENFLKENENNYILFYNYTPELLEIYDICDKLGYNIDVYCGEVKSEYFYRKYEESSLEDKFNNQKNILIANYASGSAGKNWQCYNNVIRFSLPLYSDAEQSSKRTHRDGQTKTVFYYDLFQENWLERAMLQSIKEGQEYSKSLFESDLERVKNLMKK